MRNGYYDNNQQITITYHSKIGFDDSNQKDYQLTREDNQIVIPFQILEPYDETIDPKISAFYDEELLNYFQIDSNIDKQNNIYQFTLTLKSDLDSKENFSCQMSFYYEAGSESRFSGAVILARINLEINIKTE